MDILVVLSSSLIRLADDDELSVEPESLDAGFDTGFVASSAINCAVAAATVSDGFGVLMGTGFVGLISGGGTAGSPPADLSVFGRATFDLGFGLWRCCSSRMKLCVD